MACLFAAENAAHFLNLDHVFRIARVGVYQKEGFQNMNINENA